MSKTKDGVARNTVFLPPPLPQTPPPSALSVGAWCPYWQRLAFLHSGYECIHSSIASFAFSLASNKTRGGQRISWFTYFLQGTLGPNLLHRRYGIRYWFHWSTMQLKLDLFLKENLLFSLGRPCRIWINDCWQNYHVYFWVVMSDIIVFFRSLSFSLSLSAFYLPFILRDLWISVS